MTDLEQFIEFFTMKGVPFTALKHPIGEDEGSGSFDCLSVGNALFGFSDYGYFVGMYDYASGHLSPRIEVEEKTK